MPAKAPPRTVTKKGGGVVTERSKSGLHMIWPRFLVDKLTAQRVWHLVCIAMHKHHPGRDWDEIMNFAVYRNRSSLRMVGSYKAMNCERCCSPEIRVLKKKEAKDRLVVAASLHMTDSSSGNAVKNRVWQALLDPDVAAEERAKYAAYKAMYITCYTCSQCNGHGKVANAAGGTYDLCAVLDSSDALLPELTDLARSDNFVAVHLCSVRRPAGTLQTEVRWPQSAPLAPFVEVRPKPKRAASAQSADADDYADDHE